MVRADMSQTFWVKKWTCELAPLINTKLPERKRLYTFGRYENACRLVDS